VNNSEFSSLNLSSALQDNLASLSYLQMTPIQAQSLPLVLDGKDLIAKAKTGSGKTAAFGLGLLAKLDVNRLAVQALVLAGGLDRGATRFIGQPGSVSGAIVGGLLFGAGMILTRGCASRLLILSANGNLRALLAGSS
jgi:hypothetical protein